MSIVRLSFFVGLLLLVSQQIFAQTAQDTTRKIGSIKGKVADGQNQPVSYATVTLLRADSTVVNGDLTADDGSFKIAPTGIGSFRLRIQALGVATKTVDVKITSDAPDKNMGRIKIAETENMLKEEVVTGEKPIVEMHVDKKVFNVEKNTTTAGGSAADVLQNVPAVSVDADGNVSLRGKSDVTILIDGKPATLLGSDVASALETMPAGSIESVEVITSPGAKYDAQGSTGIINIVTKKDGRLGVNGTATLGAGTHNKYNGNLGLNVRKGKWNTFVNSSFRLHPNWNNITTDRYNNTSEGGTYQNYQTLENAPRSFNGSFNSIGASYDPDKYNSISLTQNINVMAFDFDDNSNYTIYNTSAPASVIGGTPSLLENRITDQSGRPLSLSTALDYKHKFKKKGEEISFDATFSNSTIRGTQTYNTAIDTNNTQVNPNKIITLYPDIVETAPSFGVNNTVNIWADYTDPLTTNGKLSLGFKSQLYWYNSTNTPVIDTGAGYMPRIDSALFANYNYTQQIHAGYVSWNDQLGQKFAYQAGLRLEDNIYDGSGSVPRDTTFHNSYLDLFPSAMVSYKLTDDQSIYLSYNRRTNRPGFRQLLPYINLSSPGMVSTGNPGLAPEFIDNIELSYSKTDKRGDDLIFSAYYSYNQNLIETVTTPISAADALKYNVPNSELFSQPVNITSGTTYGLEGTGHIQIIKPWDATFSVNFFENQLLIGNSNPEQDQYLSNNNGFTWFGKINTNIKLPWNFSYQVNANYTSDQVIAEGTLKATWWMDMALRKNLWKNKATIIANCSDVFKTHQFITDYNLMQYTETVNRVKETRIGTITFTYRFGKTDTGKKHGKADNGLAPPTDQDRSNNLKDRNDSDNGGGQGGGTGGGQGGGGGGGGTSH